MPGSKSNPPIADKSLACGGGGTGILGKAEKQHCAI
jgi:hypothetical protein